MLIAEVKIDGEWHTRLFNCSWAQFERIAERRLGGVHTGRHLFIDI